MKMHMKSCLWLLCVLCKRQRYDAHCLGHFGLALEEYCHFTSPIRRYSDLVVHRMLHAYCFNEQKRTPSNDEKENQKTGFPYF